MSWERFAKSKVERSVKLAGATPAEAAKIADEIAKKVARRAKVRSEELFNMAAESLEKVNKPAAKEFRRVEAEKLKSTKKS